MTITAIRPSEDTSTPESRRLVRIDADLAAIAVKQDDPQGWGRLLEDERARLLGERAELLRAVVELRAKSALGA